MKVYKFDFFYIVSMKDIELAQREFIKNVRYILDSDVSHLAKCSLIQQGLNRFDAILRVAKTRAQSVLSETEEKLASSAVVQAKALIEELEKQSK